MIYSTLLEQGGVWCESTRFSWVDSPDQENGSVELLGSPERKWGVPGGVKRDIRFTTRQNKASPFYLY